MHKECIAWLHGSALQRAENILIYPTLIYSQTLTYYGNKRRVFLELSSPAGLTQIEHRYGVCLGKIYYQG